MGPPPPKCELYMAESSVPDSGWGVYTAKPLKNGHDFFPYDPVIQLVDTRLHRKRRDAWLLKNSLKSQPSDHEDILKNHEWLLLSPYYSWHSGVTSASWDARHVLSLLPGLGMLANSHPGLVNLQNLGVQIREVVNRTSPSAGAFSPYKKIGFSVNAPKIKSGVVVIPAGHELMVDHGDSWFIRQASNNNNNNNNKSLPLPLRTDYQAANSILDDFQLICFHHKYGYDHKGDRRDDYWDTDFCRDLWQLIRHDIKKAVSPAVYQILPKTLRQVRNLMAMPVISKGKLSVYHSFPNAVRSLEWLSENGFCIDNLKVNISLIEGAGSGAFANRFLSNGTMVSPVPVVHMHRDHLKMFLTDKFDSNVLIWEGHQLLLNYVYGHPSTSLVFFPFAPTVNFINHGGKAANVKLQWSERAPHPEWMNMTTRELLSNTSDGVRRSGLLMEMVALRDIRKDEEILLDYGPAWEEAWTKHGANYQPESKDANDYYESPPFHSQLVLPMASIFFPSPKYRNVREESLLPSQVMTVCWINTEGMEPTSVPLQEAPLVPHVPRNEYVSFYTEWESDGVEQAMYISDAQPCYIESRRVAAVFRTPPYEQIMAYTVVIEGKQDSRGDAREKEYFLVTDVPRAAIDVVDRPYTTNQHMRNAFRSEIGLPDHMIPPKWMDVMEEGNIAEKSECRFYMAESSIPDSGLGVFTAVDIADGTDIFHSDMVIQAEDVEMNARLRRWHYNITREDPAWLLKSYFWSATSTRGNFEAESVQSIIPGLGMLANSHPGLVNAALRHPFQDRGGLHRHRDPGVGASTFFHDLRYSAAGKIEKGAEIFVEYGDEWFEGRPDMGSIPLSSDFERADELLNDFTKIVEGDTTSEMAKDLWDLLWDVSSSSSGPEEDGIHPNETEDEEEDTDWIRNYRLRNALPRRLEDVDRVAKMGTARHSVPNRVRSIEWLKQNGHCLDNILPGWSKIPQASWGAFAARNMSEGQVIAPAPLVHLRREQMEVYDSNDVNNQRAKTWLEGQQLLLNYCFGHSNSSVLLFPYSPVVNYINHDHHHYNARLRWSSMPQHRSEMMRMSVDELMKQDHAGLIMEFVAVRDIVAGEEITIDYGAQWHRNWSAYATHHWQPPRRSEEYRPASEWNENYLEPIRTDFEQATSPYPKNIILLCYVNVDMLQGPSKAVLARYAEANVPYYYDWVFVEDLFESTRHAHQDCEIQSRNGTDPDTYSSVKPEAFTNEYYTIKIVQDRQDRKKKREWLVRNVPRGAIQFVDAPYTSDAFLRNAFRFPIGLPDEMLPSAWSDQDPQVRHEGGDIMDDKEEEEEEEEEFLFDDEDFQVDDINRHLDEAMEAGEYLQDGEEFLFDDEEFRVDDIDWDMGKEMEDGEY